MVEDDPGRKAGVQRHNGPLSPLAFEVGSQ